MSAMNELQKKYFEALSGDRAESADMLEKPSMRGIKNSVVEKYSDQAHFIYELLQNADDAEATRARFLLEPDRLIFAHNGTRQFSVTDPAYEDRDSGEGRLGDINAITSIANSNKTEASIGKFGVGFKAVFQYTSTPHIYTPEFRFKIERFIVPTLLEADFPGRREEETLFVFPFDHPERDAGQAREDIADKLTKLSFPLLFLSGLKEIEFAFGDVLGLYGKHIKKVYTYEETTCEYISLTQNRGEDLHDENLWLFSRSDECGRRYSVGFFTDAEGHLRPVKEPAFCFFPTKEVTGLNFILHAPFLLTDSREGIRAGVPHNDEMLRLLAGLAADAVVLLKEIGGRESIRLIEDTILTIIPVNPEEFSDPADRGKVSFLPFYQAVREMFEKTAILPGAEGYAASENAYWAAVQQLPQLFSNEQLRDICGNENAQWVFVTQGRDEVQRVDKALFAYMDSLVKTNLSEDVIINGRSRGFTSRVGVRQAPVNIKGITAEFIEAQSIEWLHGFYKWLFETRHRTEIVKNKPIFPDQNGRAVPAFDKEGQPILFLPVKDITGYTVVHPDLLKNPDTRKFIDTVGIRQPSLKDQIYNIVLPQYAEDDEIDTAPHFMLFFKYFCKCSNDEVDTFIEMIKDCEFLTYYDTEDSQIYRGAADTIYLPVPDIKAFLETKAGVRFLELEEYRELVDPKEEELLLTFLKKLGVRQEIALITTEIDFTSGDRNDLPHPYSTRGHKWKETTIEGCREIVACIAEEQDREKSILLWNCLLHIIETKCGTWRHRNLSMLLTGICSYFYYSPQTERFPSSDAVLLRNSKWLVNEENEFVLPQEVTRSSLSAVYDVSSEYAEELLDFLKIPYAEEGTEEPEHDDSNLTEEQRQKILLADKLREYGIGNEADLEEFRAFMRRRGEQKRAEEPAQVDEGFGNGDGKEAAAVVKDILRRTGGTSAGGMAGEGHESGLEQDNDADWDELMPSSVDYSRKIEQAKQKSAAEIDRILYYEELQKKALSAGKYTFAWFNALMEMESINSGEANSNSREVSISFGKVEKEPGTKRTLLLKYPNRYIPQFMEDLTDIPLVLHTKVQTRTEVIEVASVKSYTLRVKLKNGADIEGLDLSTVTAATIDAKSPAFLLEELRKQFAELPYADDFNMQEQLCRNIEFIFGPPGTGKTTHLAKNVLLPLMKEKEGCKVLVLTPTNKSADVLTRRIMEVSGTDHSYEDWLVRFGATGDEEIEQSPVYRDKTFDIRRPFRTVTITTIARFPYDFFMPPGERIFLRGIRWDYIVMDEASMISLANIVYPLYRKTPEKFIIAGDPFQIEPITSVDLWKNENIYTMVQLDTFVQPKTIPHPYKVELLTTQYRSIPDIGGIFSRFAYGGILKHYRSAKSRKPLIADRGPDIKTLNIIKYPVSRYESIYRAKRLQHSSAYQVYSALFTFEYVCHLCRSIAAHYPDSLYKIGIIAPYRAQSDMIEKLMASEELPRETDVQVGTIHGFQGDECDIVFAVFNTPPNISVSGEMFLNKRNIINVSISRARDYLFIVMPDDNTENIENLRLVRRVERLIKRTNAWNEFLTKDLEELMFGDPQYLENNAFSTGHQSVNVYGLPEKCYEVRTEDNAVDVQIHKK